MTGRSVVLGSAAAVAIVLAACTSSYGESAPSAFPDDAGDARVAAEASLDGPKPSGDGAPALPFECAAQEMDPGLLYCNAFERPTDALDPFGFTSSTVPNSGASVAVIRDGERLHVLRVTMTMLSTMSNRDVALMQKLDVATLPRSLRLDFDVKIVTSDLAAVTLADLHLAGSGCEASVGLGAFGGAAVSTTRAQTFGIPYGPDWQHVTISLLADPKSSTGYREVSS